MLPESLDVFLADFGVPVTAGSVSCLGIFDTPDEMMNMAGHNVISTMRVCTVKTSDAQAAGIVSGSSITVAGTAYTVRDVMLEDDGAFTKLALSY